MLIAPNACKEPNVRADQKNWRKKLERNNGENIQSFPKKSQSRRVRGDLKASLVESLMT